MENPRFNHTDVVVKIKSAQIDLNGDENRLELTTMGKMWSGGDVCFLSYQEVDPADSSVTETLICYDGKSLTMNRKGGMNTVLVFAAGTRCDGAYETPFGELAMSVFPSLVHCSFNAGGGSVRLKYQLDIEGRYVSENRLSIKFMPRGN